jgi:hypothetical protein
MNTLHWVLLWVVMVTNLLLLFRMMRLHDRVVYLRKLVTGLSSASKNERESLNELMETLMEKNEIITQLKSDLLYCKLDMEHWHKRAFEWESLHRNLVLEIKKAYPKYEFHPVNLKTDSHGE